MARKDFSKPFFMGSFAEKNYGPPSRRPMNRAPPMMMPFNDDYGPMDFDRPFGPPRGFDDGFSGFRPSPAPLGFNRGPPLPFMGGGGGGNDMFMEPGMGYGRSGFEDIGFRRLTPNETRRQAVSKFLLRCGVHETIIKQLPKDLIKMFSPENCFLCSVKMDSFPISRLHYTSRLHFNKVMKYLQDWSKRTGKLMPSIERQEPLKARNLYCELCDVAITSKPHAESHYFGKAHNSIVLGRKAPKNPALHGPEKAERLELLLRRERKLLNVSVMGKGDQAKPVAPAALESKPKDIVPELYCDVCSITVTCAEQMLSHKNGKKHLAKEKNKILNFTKVNSLKKIAEGAENGAKENGTKDGEGAEAAKDAAKNKNDEAMTAVKEEITVKVEEAMEEEKADDSWVDGTGEGWDSTANDGVTEG